MYAVGKLHIATSAFYTDMEEGGMRPKGGGEYGTYVLWQKSPELWYFDLILAGCMLTMGCNGHIAWKQSTIKRSCITKGPPRPLRRSLQVNIKTNLICLLSRVQIFHVFYATKTYRGTTYRTKRNNYR